MIKVEMSMSLILKQIKQVCDLHINSSHSLSSINCKAAWTIGYIHCILAMHCNYCKEYHIRIDLDLCPYGQENMACVDTYAHMAMLSGWNVRQAFSHLFVFTNSRWSQ